MRRVLTEHARADGVTGAQGHDELVGLPGGLGVRNVRVGHDDPAGVDDETGAGTRLAADRIGCRSSRRCARPPARPSRGSNECRPASRARSTVARRRSSCSGCPSRSWSWIRRRRPARRPRRRLRRPRARRSMPRPARRLRRAVRAGGPRAVAPTDRPGSGGLRRRELGLDRFDRGSGRSRQASTDPSTLPASDTSATCDSSIGAQRFAASPESLLKERSEVPEQPYGRLERLGCLKND